MSTNVSSVVSHFPDAENGFTTTLASTISSGATTVPLNSVAGYTNGMPAVFVVDPTDTAKKQTFTGIIDTAGVQVTSVVWTAGTNQTHAGGATVVDYATATHMAMMTKGILVGHDQDGTHKTNSIAAKDLATSAIKIGYASRTSNFQTTSTTAVQVTDLTSTVTIPAGSRSVKISMFAQYQTSSAAGNNAISIWDGTVGSGTQLASMLISIPGAGNAHYAICSAIVTPSAGSKTYNIGFAAGAGTATLAAAATSPMYILVEVI